MTKKRGKKPKNKKKNKNKNQSQQQQPKSTNTNTNNNNAQPQNNNKPKPNAQPQPKSTPQSNPFSGPSGERSFLEMLMRSSGSSEGQMNPGKILEMAMLDMLRNQHHHHHHHDSDDSDEDDYEDDEYYDDDDDDDDDDEGVNPLAQLLSALMNHGVDDDDSESDEEANGADAIAWVSVRDHIDDALSYHAFQSAVTGMLMAARAQSPGLKGFQLKSLVSNNLAWKPQPTLVLLDKILQEAAKSPNPPSMNEYKKFDKNNRALFMLKDSRWGDFTEEHYDDDRDTMASGFDTYDMGQDDYEYYFSEDDDPDDPQSEYKNYWKSIGVEVERIKVGNWSPDVSYSSQIRMKFEPMTGSLVFYMHLHPAFHVKDDEDAKLLFEDDRVRGNRLLDCAKEWQTSRVMRWEILLENITGILHHETNLGDDLSLLAFEVKAPPVFHTRRVSTNSYQRDQWRKRPDFTPNQEISRNKKHYILANTKTLRRIMSLILYMEKHGSMNFPQLLQKGMSSNQLLTQDRSLQPIGVAPKTRGSALLARIQKQRTPVPANTLNVLKKHKLLKPNVQYPPLPPISSVPEKENETDNFSDCVIDNCNINYCFLDACRTMDHQKIDKILSSRLTHDHGDSESDKKKKTTVAQYFQTTRDAEDEEYYSMCRETIMTREHDSHCPFCMECNDWHFWHCFNCERCSYGQSTSVCEHCGSESGQPHPEGRKPALKAMSFSYSDDDEEDNEYLDYDSETDTPVYVPGKLVRQTDGKGSNTEAMGDTAVPLSRPDMHSLINERYRSDSDGEDDDDDEDDHHHGHHFHHHPSCPHHPSHHHHHHDDEEDDDDEDFATDDDEEVDDDEPPELLDSPTATRSSSVSQPATDLKGYTDLDAIDDFPPDS